MSIFISLSSLAMDLDRVAVGLHRGSYKMAERFTEEALKRKREIDLTAVKPYIKNLLEKMEVDLKSEDKGKKAEDALMYSTLFQNAALAS